MMEVALQYVPTPALWNAQPLLAIWNLVQTPNLPSLVIQPPPHLSAQCPQHPSKPVLFSPTHIDSKTVLRHAIIAIAFAVPPLRIEHDSDFNA